ncbi:unnamed protein product [Closterium sp. NIES-54]
MASPSVLTFDAKGRAVDFEVWIDDLELFLQCDSKDGLSLFDLTSGASTAPAANADSTVRSQWTTRDAAARLAMRSHLPSTERTHFSQYKSAKTLYDAVVARYSSPATAALSHLMLPYLFPDRGGESGGAESGGAEPAGARPGGPSGAFRATGAGGAAGAGGSTAAGGAGATGPRGARTGGTGAAGPGGATGARAIGGAGAGRAAGVGATGGTGAGAAAGASALVGARVGATGAGAPGGTGAGGAAGAGAPVGAGVGATRAAGGAADAGSAAGVGADAAGANAVPAGSGGATRPRPYFSSCSTSPSSCGPWHASDGPSPSTAPQRVPFLSPPESSLPALADPESDSLRAASPTITRFLATVVTDPSFESTAASALVAELVDFAARCRLDYATRIVAESESESVCPPSVGGDCALSTDVLEDRQEEFQCFATALPHLGPSSSQWQAAMDAEMASWKSTGTYVNEVPPPGANIGVDYFQTFSPTPKMTTLRVLLHFAAQRDYELHSLDFSTTFLQGSQHEEIWLRSPPGFTGSFPPGTQWSLQQPVYGLRQAPREWHDTPRTTLAALGFAPSTADPSLFLRTDTLLPPFYILVYVDDLVFATGDTAGLAHVKSELHKRHTCTDLGELCSYLGLQITWDRARRTITQTQSHMVQQVLQRFDFTYSSPQATPLSTRHSLSALPSDESIEPSGLYPELVGCLMYLMTCTRPDLAYPLMTLACYVAPGRHRPEHMAVAKRVLRYLCSTLGMGLVLGGRSPVVLSGHADASWVDDLATQRSSQGYTFSLGSGSISWRSTLSSSVLSSSCEAEIYVGAMAA